MRRKEKEITDPLQLESILTAANECTLALIDGDRPYSLPMNFGYKSNRLFLHSAKEGRKIDIIRKNPVAGFSVVLDASFTGGEKACDWGTRYRSIIGSGSVRILEDESEKREALLIIMKQISGRDDWEISSRAVSQTTVFSLDIEEMAGKKSGLDD